MTCYGPTSEAEGTCFVDQNGCITDGPGDHGNNERCTIDVLRDSYLYVSGSFDVETFFDYFTINGSSTRLDTVAELDFVPIAAGATIRWQSDGSVVNDGWTLCGSV